MDLSELNELDFSNIGSWSTPIKAGFIVIIVVALLGAGYWFDTKDQLQQLEQLEGKERNLKSKFEKLAEKAVNLELYRQQMEEMKEAFAIMLKQLPKKAEVDALLVDISQTGLAAGLEFELFKPGTAHVAEFYDLPIQIRVTGQYHEFGQFVSGAAALPRIVTLHDVSISGTGGRGSEESDLRMDVTAKIYHYREEGAP
jgi:type IV pilus assembly protein PilO